MSILGMTLVAVGTILGTGALLELAGRIAQHHRRHLR